MPYQLASGLSTYQRITACKTSNGDVLWANGIDVPYHWNGSDLVAYPAGIIKPSTAVVIADGGAGAITGTYTAYVRFIDADGVASNLSPISNTLTITTEKIDYSSIPVSAEARVTKREIYRNTDGQAKTLYLVTTIADNVTTTYTGDNLDDNTLILNTALRLLDPVDSSVVANRFDPPPPNKAVVVHTQGRSLWGVDIVYREGFVALTNGSATVTGYGTHFTAPMVGRVFYPGNQLGKYLISAVNVTTQTLTLANVFAGTSDAFASYALRTVASERKRVYYGYAGEPESVYTLQNDVVSSDGPDDDDLTTMKIMGSLVYLFTDRHVHRWTFQVNPGTDGHIYPNASRGCVNQQCAVLVDDALYCLDRDGIYSFGGGTPAAISDDIQDFFKPGGINWDRARFFSAAKYAPENIVKWFVCLGSMAYPRHALCYNYREGSWHIEEYPWEIGSCASVPIGGQLRLVLGSEHESMYLSSEGTLDGPSLAFTSRLDVVSASYLSITVAYPDFGADDIAGSTVTIVSGRGKGQTRRILTANASTGLLRLDYPLMIVPNEESVVQIGGIGWTYRTGIFSFASSENNNTRQLDLVFEPTPNTTNIEARLFHNHDDTPQIAASEFDNRDGVTISKGDDAAVIALKSTTGTRKAREVGYRRWEFSGFLDQQGPSDRYASLELRGCSTVDPLTIYSITIDGVTTPRS